jgi:catechol 2,3-dioxygenase-like lactoylglutathione lyase family enzyme
MNPRISVITLGVRDLGRARRFYREGLGWPIGQEDDNWVCFTLGGGVLAFALYPWGGAGRRCSRPSRRIWLSRLHTLICRPFGYQGSALSGISALGES